MTGPLQWMTTKLDAAVGWARKFSIFQYPFVTACCGMEYMATACSHYDVDRFGAGFPRFSPRQADVLFVVGTISHKLAPVLKKIYDQMTEPKWVVAFGVCTCTGGFYDNYATLMGIDTIMPVDVYIPGCPPRPENVLDGLIKLQAKIQAQHTGTPLGTSSEAVAAGRESRERPGVREGARPSPSAEEDRRGGTLGSAPGASAASDWRVAAVRRRWRPGERAGGSDAPSGARPRFCGGCPSCWPCQVAS